MCNGVTSLRIDLIDNGKHVPGLFGKFIWHYRFLKECAETSKIYGTNSPGVNQMSELTRAVMGKAVISMHNYFKVSKVIQFQRPECHWFTPAEDMARRTDKKWLCLLITEAANVFQLVLTGFMSLEN